jgi:nucleotide-binding universal stress UspA family protein
MLKDILVHVDRSKECGERLKVAIQLARTHEAHLTGAYVIPRSRIPNYLEVQVPKEILDKATAARLEEAAEARKTFEAACRAGGIPCEWRQAEGPAVETLALSARYADLAIVGQRNVADEDYEVDEMPDRFILSAGRPVLVVPYAGVFPRVGQAVVVSWDASRLATRAVNDALPILRKAEKVHLLAINPEGGREGHGDVPGADIGLHLARHGVKAEASSIRAEDIDIGDALLSRAADFGADLIVMGAYGHSRWRELVLGGVTRHLLNHMTAPVFMSH